MTARLVAVARRFLSDRSFTLIVAPALADFEFSAASRQVSDYLAVARALGGAAWEDATSDSAALTFVALALLPATYYTIFFMLWMPAGFRYSPGAMLVVAACVFTISLIPVAICYWPDKSWPAHDSTHETTSP